MLVLLYLSRIFMKRAFTLCFVVCSFALLLSSCGEVKEITEVNVASSIQVNPFLEKLFAHDIFKDHGYKFNYIDLNSSQARKALKSGIVDLYVTDEDFNKLDGKELLREKLIAKDALLLITNSDNSIHNYQSSDDLSKLEIFDDMNTLSKYLSDNSGGLALIRASLHEDRVKQKIVYINDIAPIKSNFDFGNYPLVKKIKLYYKISVLRKKEKYKPIRKLIKVLNSEEVHGIIDSLAMINPNSNELLLERLAEEPIRIGVGVPLKNQYAKSGKAVVAAVKVVADSVNKGGGIQGREIEVHVCDDEANIKDALKAIDCAQDFIKLGVKAVIGHLGSEASIATSGIYQEHNIVQISPTAVHPGFTHQENNRGLLFRTIPMDFNYSDSIYELLRLKLDELKEKKVLIIHNDSLYVKNILSQIISKLRRVEHLNKQISINSVNLSNGDFRDSKLLNDLDFNLLIVLGPEFDLFDISSYLNSINKTQKKITLISESHTYTPYSKSHPDFEGVNLYIAAPRINMHHQDFIDLRSDFSKSSKDLAFNSAAVLSYISARALFDSMESYYTGSYSSIADALHQQTFSSFGEEFEFTDKGDRADESMALYKFDNGAFEKL